MVKMGNKEFECINAIRKVEEKWNRTEEELKMEMNKLENRMNQIHDQFCFTKQNIEMMEEEVIYFSKTMESTGRLSDYFQELSDVYEKLNSDYYGELAHLEQIHQLKQKELQQVSETCAKDIARLRKELYVEN